jgi:hypothetical protein
MLMVLVSVPPAGARTVRCYFLVRALCLVSRQGTLCLLSRRVQLRLGYAVQRCDD